MRVLFHYGTVGEESKVPKLAPGADDFRSGQHSDSFGPRCNPKNSTSVFRPEECQEVFGCTEQELLDKVLKVIRADEASCNNPRSVAVAAGLKIGDTQQDPRVLEDFQAAAANAQRAFRVFRDFLKKALGRVEESDKVRINRVLGNHGTC